MLLRQRLEPGLTLPKHTRCSLPPPAPAQEFIFPLTAGQYKFYHIYQMSPKELDSPSLSKATLKVKGFIFQKLHVSRRSQSIENIRGLTWGRVNFPTLFVKHHHDTNPEFSAPSSCGALLPGQHITFLILPVLNDYH